MKKTRFKFPTCFISYCHSNIDRELVDYLIYIIKRSLNQKVEIMYDSDLRPAENLSNFMDKTLDVDVAILLLTPTYKQKVENREGGVYKEFKNIMTRYYAIQDDNNSEIKNSFLLIPVIISGSIEESIPKLIKDLLCINLIGFSVAKNKKGKFILPNSIKIKYSTQIQKITDELVVFSNLKSKYFQRIQKDLYDALFVNTKTDENILKKCPDFFSNVFVPTTSYLNIQEQRSYFLIGRKGSGKSTLATALKVSQPNRYNDSITIQADSVNLNTAYGNLRPGTIAEIQNLLPGFSFFIFSWQGFLCLCIIELLEHLDAKNKITDIQKNNMAPLKEFLNRFRRQHNPKNLRGAFFTNSTLKLQEYLEECIRNARETENGSGFFTDVSVAFNVQDYLLYLLGADVVIALANIIKNCKKRVLVSLDDFDTIFDTFRRSASSSDDAYLRTQFEVDWLRSLLLLVLDIKDSQFENNPFFATLDFCITIPKDRYLEIERSERDAYRYGPRTSNIDWSGIELCDVLFRRLQKLYDFSGMDDASPHERLFKILKDNCPKIPDQLSFTFNEKNISMPLFCYVLRHTFWRPREIMMYYADIIAASTTVTKAGYSLNVTAIKRIISEIARRIIKTEFLDEFQGTFQNIGEIIGCFKKYPQRLTLHKIREAIDKTPFILSSLENPIFDLKEKIEFLYDIGFLGLVLNDDIVSLLNLGMNEAFYFNEGSSPMQTSIDNDFKDTEFCIHPIFSEYLLLDYRANDFLLNFSWQYLYDNHIIKAATLF